MSADEAGVRFFGRGAMGGLKVMLVERETTKTWLGEGRGGFLASVAGARAKETSRRRRTPL